MSVKDILAFLAVMMILCPAVAVTYSWCVEIYFNRKEEHLKWLVKGGKKE